MIALEARGTRDGAEIFDERGDATPGLVVAGNIVPAWWLGGNAGGDDGSSSL